MTRPEIIVIIITAICVFVIVAQYVHARHEIAKHGQAEFERGWLEGWDDRENNRHPDSPEPKGRHHISQPEDWIGNDLTEFLLQPPLPKRKPAGTTQERQA